MTWTRSQPATAHRAPIYSASPNGYLRTTALELQSGLLQQKSLSTAQGFACTGTSENANHIHQASNKQSHSKARAKGSVLIREGRLGDTLEDSA